jgi:hypothetical protein
MERSSLRISLLIAIVSLLAACSTAPTAIPLPTPASELAPRAARTSLATTLPPTEPASPTAVATKVAAQASATTAPTAAPADPFALISQDSLLAFLEDLTTIQPYSGWRNSASEGEAEALDYVTQKLQSLDYLNELGLELERQEFRVFLGTELWDTRLHLTVGGKEIEVPADGLRGPRDPRAV